MYVVVQVHVSVVADEVLQQMLVPLVGGIVRQRITHPVDALVDVYHLSLLLDEAYYAVLVAQHDEGDEVGLLDHNAISHSSQISGGEIIRCILHGVVGCRFPLLQQVVYAGLAYVGVGQAV